MDILMVASEVPPTRSGVALVCGELAARFRQRGHEVELLCRRALPYLALGEARVSAAALYGRRIRSRMEPSDVILVHGPAPTFSDAVLLSSRRAARRGPLVYCHHFDLSLPRWGALCRLYNRFHARLVAATADAVVFTTEAYRRAWALPGRLERIPHGGDHRPVGARPEAGGDESCLRVLFVGQMRPYKGVDVLLQALVGLEGVEARLVGAGPLLERYVAAERRPRPGIRFLGRLSDQDLAVELATADVVVLPSVSSMEAFGLVLVEGMRSGCVPVASRLVGVEEVVGDAGLLHTPGNVAELRDCLVRLRDDRELRARLGQAARIRGETFRWGDTVDRYLGLFEELLGERCGPRASAGTACRPGEASASGPP